MGTITHSVGTLNSDYINNAFNITTSNLSVSGVANCQNVVVNQLYFNGTNQNTYLDAEEITYKNPNGDNQQTSNFYVEEVVASEKGLLQPYVMRTPIVENGSNPETIIGLESTRRCFSLSGGNQTFTLRFTIPNLTTGSVPIPAIEHYFVINKTTTGNTTINLQPNDDSGSIVSGQLWSLSTYKHYNTTGSLLSAGANALTGTGTLLPTLSSFKGFITIRGISLASPNNQGALCFQSECWEKP